MKPLRVPRVDTAKLGSVEPADRRPAVDLLGDSLCRLGVVRLLVQGEASSEVSSGPRGIQVHTVFASLEDYFGLEPGRLSGRVGVVEKGRAQDSDTIEGEVGHFVALGTTGFSSDAPPEDLALHLADQSTARWRVREEECLFVSSSVLSAWTGGVVPVAKVKGSTPVDSLRVWSLLSREPNDLEQLREFDRAPSTDRLMSD